jgi:lysyl-tRNA synthetase class II
MKVDIEYLETFFFVTETVIEELNKDNQSLINLVENGGRFELVEVTKEITNKFQEINDSREWDGEFLEEIYSFTIDFINNKL